MSAQRILLVEDDHYFASILQQYLEKQGYQVIIEPNGIHAVRRITSEQPDAVLLDGILPGMDGFEVCREVRANYAGPIIMLTSRDDNYDQILGLELGADDYLVKPVEPRLVLAHLKAQLRRSNLPQAIADDSQVCLYGQLQINQRTRRVVLCGQEIELTDAEFELLWLLASHAGTILSRDDIFNHQRGIDYNGLDRSIDMRISRLRSKLGDEGGNPRRIKSVRGKGYLFTTDAWD